MLITMQKISGFLFFSQFCITCIVQEGWNGAFVSNISCYLNEMLVLTLKCHYHNSITTITILLQRCLNNCNTITIVKMGAIVTPIGHWPLDVDSTDHHHHFTIVQVCYKCFSFSPQEEKPGNVDITKTDTRISW